MPIRKPLQGMFALHYFPNAKALEPLCRFIDSDAPVIDKETAMMQLRELHDERAVPTLTRVLFDTSTTFDQRFGTAAIALSACGKKGFITLVKALTHSDPRIRLAVQQLAWILLAILMRLYIWIACKTTRKQRSVIEPEFGWAIFFPIKSSCHLVPNLRYP